jgi:hypothetical protein
MAFIYSVEELENLAKNHDITDLECETILNIVDREHKTVFENLATNPAISPKVLSMCIGDYQLCYFAVRNDSLDLFIYRDENYISKDNQNFLKAISEKYNIENFNTLRFANYATKRFLAHQIIDYDNIFNALAPDIQKDVQLTYLKKYLGGEQVTERVQKLIRNTEHPEVIVAIWEKFPKLNAAMLSNFIQNLSTPNEILQKIFIQLKNEYKTLFSFLGDNATSLMKKTVQHPKFEPTGEHFEIIKQLENVPNNLPVKAPPTRDKIFDAMSETEQSQMSLANFNKLREAANKDTTFEAPRLGLLKSVIKRSNSNFRDFSSDITGKGL